MKKLMRTILGLTLALSLCVGVSAAAFGAEKSSDNVSLDDILGHLSSLSTEEIEEREKAFNADAAVGDRAARRHPLPPDRYPGLVHGQQGEKLCRYRDPQKTAGRMV